MSSDYTGKPCPKCGYVRSGRETAPDWQCPKCEIAYKKYVEARAGEASFAAGQSARAAAVADLDLTGQREVFVTQKFELAEVFGFESGNRYRISDAKGRPLGYAAEERKGVFGFLFRQMFGHWRSFEIHVYNNARQTIMHAVHPFRFYFARLEVFDLKGQRIGAIQKRFSLLTKRFSVEDARGVPIMEVASPVWKIWTFPFVANGEEVASVQKKWSGLLSEAFTDRDNFRVAFESAALGNDERKVVLAAAIFVDLKYFEKKA